MRGQFGLIVSGVLQRRRQLGLWEAEAIFRPPGYHPGGSIRARFCRCWLPSGRRKTSVATHVPLLVTEQSLEENAQAERFRFQESPCVKTRGSKVDTRMQIGSVTTVLHRGPVWTLPYVDGLRLSSARCMPGAPCAPCGHVHSDYRGGMYVSHVRHFKCAIRLVHTAVHPSPPSPSCTLPKRRRQTSQTRTPRPRPHSRPLATTLLLSVPTNVTTLGASPKWNHTVFILLCLAYFM